MINGMFIKITNRIKSNMVEISDSNIERLNSLSKKQNLSSNDFLTNMLNRSEILNEEHDQFHKKYNEIHSHMKYISFPKDMLRLIYSGITPEFAKKIGSIYSKTNFHEETTLQKKGESKWTNVLEFNKDWIKICGWDLLISHNNDVEKWTISHNLGINFSHSLGEFFKITGEVLNENIDEIRVTENDLNLSFRK